LTTLDAKHPEAFDALYADLRGDVLVAAGRAADARVAYETALSKLDPKSGYRSYVQVKRDAIAGPDKVAAGTAGAPGGDAGKAASPAQSAAASKDAAKSGNVGVAANDAAKGASGASK
jgi:hypothetical protein